MDKVKLAIGQAGKVPAETVLIPLVVYSAKVPSVAVSFIWSFSFAVYG